MPNHDIRAVFAILLLLTGTVAASFGDEDNKIYDDFIIKRYSTGVTLECINDSKTLLPGDTVNITIISKTQFYSEKFIFKPGCKKRYVIQDEQYELALQPEYSRLPKLWDGEENTPTIIQTVKQKIQLEDIALTGLFTLLLIFGVYLLIKGLKISIAFILFGLAGLVSMAFIILTKI